MVLRAGGWLGVGNDPVYIKSRCFDPFPFPDPPESLKAEIRAVAEELDAFRKARQAEHPKLTLTQMYNVLEKLKAMAAAQRAASVIPGRSAAEGKGIHSAEHDRQSPSLASGSPGMTRSETVALTPDEERIKDEGLILILKELHERLDAARVPGLWLARRLSPTRRSSNGWWRSMPSGRRRRRRASCAGSGPITRSRASPRARPPLKPENSISATNVVAIDRSLPDFPKDRHEDSLAVERALLAAGRPMDAAALARGFRRGGKRIEPRIAQALTTLVRYGRIGMTPMAAISPAGRREAETAEESGIPPSLALAGRDRGWESKSLSAARRNSLDVITGLVPVIPIVCNAVPCGSGWPARGRP